MAKGDHGRVQDEIGSQKQIAQYGYGSQVPSGSSGFLRRTGAPNTPTLGTGGMVNLFNTLGNSQKSFSDNYNSGAGMNLNSYDEIMNNYRNFLGGNTAGNGDLAGARSTFGDMASTGGVNVAAIRDRAMSPVRAMYSNARREVDRGASLAGGFAPNKIAALAKMTRDQSINASDAATNAEAMIAELISRNRLAGASGLAGLGGDDGKMNLAAISGMTNLFGTAPGMTSVMGNQLLGADQNLLNAQNMQNQLSQMLVQSRLQNAQVPGNFSQAMGNIGSVLGLGGQLAGSLVGLGGGAGNALSFGNVGSQMPINIPGVGMMGNNGLAGLFGSR